MMILQNVPRASEVLDLGGLEVDYFLDRMADKGAQFDMAFEFAETPDGLEGILTFPTALFDVETAQRLIDGFIVYLTAGANSPEMRLGALPVMSEPARRNIDSFQCGAALEDAAELPDLIAAMPAEAPAVLGSDGEWLSYGALRARADHLAAALQNAGAGRGDVIGICVSRTPDLPAAMLAAWRIGAAFVPINMNDPTERRGHMLEQSRAVALIVDDATAPTLAEHAVTQIHCSHVAAGAPRPARGHLAYVIFTSGSTGTPKGVAVGHSALGHLHAAIAAESAHDGQGLPDQRV